MGVWIAGCWSWRDVWPWVLLGWADELDADGMSWMLEPEKQKTGPTSGLELDLVIDPDFARGRLSTRQLTTEAEMRPDTVH